MESLYLRPSSPLVFKWRFHHLVDMAFGWAAVSVGFHHVASVRSSSRRAQRAASRCFRGKKFETARWHPGQARYGSAGPKQNNKGTGAMSDVQPKLQPDVIEAVGADPLASAWARYLASVGMTAAATIVAIGVDSH